MKGIILAGGRATRLYPITKGIGKQLLPVYDKPMVYYPLSVLLLAGIKEILIVSTPEHIQNFQHLFDDGSHLGIRISYATQYEPKGIAEAFILAEKFINEEPVCLVLGDNIFYGEDLTHLLSEARDLEKGASIFAYNVKDPERYGVITFNEDQKVTSIVEKPKIPTSNWAVTGLYFYDNQVVEIAKKLKPSARGELEITDINKAYLKKGQLSVKLLGRGFAWLDTGTYDSLIDASIFIKTIQDRQGLKIGCIEEIVYRKGYIDAKQLKLLAKELNTSYGDYLKQIAKNE